MRGKKGNVGVLGRALIKQHNQMVRESKEKGRALGLQRRRVLESVTDVSDIDTVLQKAEEADRVYTIGNPSPDVLVTLDPSSDGDATMVEEKMQLQKQEEALYASSLQIPRRPPWNTHMSVEELDANEKQAFLVWRRNLARLEENDKLVLTPFEKNLDIWRQLWRVLERSDLLVMVVDGRDPLFYRCPDLENYAREIDEHKKTLLLVNKADLLPVHIRQRWADYFNQKNILFVFWSAKAASATLEGKKLSNAIEEKSTKKHESYKEIQGANSDALDTKIYGRDDLLARLQSEAEAIAAHRRHGDNKETQETNSDGGSTAKHVIVGFVGYPNVGKSSTINALVGQKRTGVTSTPGKTKHFQTLIISDELVLCDCPGLVFPSFSSSRYEMIASGVLPIDRMTEHRQAVQVVADCVARNALESIYNIILPRPKTYEVQSRPPLSSELLRAYCSSRGYVSSSGLPDETRAARQILKDYIDGKLPHFKMPPEAIDDDMEVNAVNGLADESSLADSETDDGDSIIEDDQSALSVSVDTDQHNLSYVLDDLESFDLASGLPSKKAAALKNPNKTYKHHKKPQRKKDRTWRVGNINEDGMPVVRVFQKPAVNLSSLEPSA